MPRLFSHIPFLPLVTPSNDTGDLPEDDLLLSLARIAPVLIPAPALKTVLSILPRTSEYWALLTEDLSADVAIPLLDAGAAKIVTSNLDLFDQLPAERLVLALNEDTLDKLADDPELAASVQSVLLETTVSSKGFNKDLISEARTFMGGKSSRDSKDLFIMPVGDQNPTLAHLEALASWRLGTTACLPTSILSAEVPPVPLDGIASAQITSTDLPAVSKKSNGFHLPIDVLFLSTLSTDRPDNLYATLVSALSEPPLGLVYSSPLSISISILTAQATYHSRSRSSLWVKGATSGATQRVVAIRRDCDGDALEFIVEQRDGTGFCHTLRASSCFGPSSGLAALESTLNERRRTAPVGSYTKRLFDDDSLLEAKLREEAEEVCQARDWEETRLEAADLLYFLLVRCTAKGVKVSDVQDVLDARASKVTRRPGHAKQPYLRSPVLTAHALLNGTKNQTNGTSSGQTSRTTTPTAANPLAIHEARSTALPATLADIQPESAGVEEAIIPPVYDLSKLNKQERAQLLKRPLMDSKEMLSKVQPLVSDVRVNGDVALRQLVSKLDRCQAASESDFSLVLRAPFSEDLMRLPEETRIAIDTAFANIYKFHLKQMEKESQPMLVETMPGIKCSRFARAISRVGVYVPGGTAVLPSTAMMLCIPASIAGCDSITLATPPDQNGNVRPEIVYIASKCGVKEILKAGGAHAVAAMAYGTLSVTKVDKLFGPGNQWVTAAKMVVSMDTSAAVSIDMPAGPSEVLVIADQTANPVFVASDLLSQAEHGPDSQVVLLAIDLTDEHLEKVKQQVSKQALALPRAEIVRKCISKSLIIRLTTRDDALAFSNDYAPEHLILHVENAENVLPEVQNAGSVFVGQWSPESMGDYASGTNHTLPTMAYARQYSGVSTSSFLKHITSQQLTLEGLKLLGPTVDHLARIEGLDAHARAVTLRLATAEAL